MPGAAGAELKTGASDAPSRTFVDDFYELVVPADSIARDSLSDRAAGGCRCESDCGAADRAGVLRGRMGIRRSEQVSPSQGVKWWPEPTTPWKTMHYSFFGSSFFVFGKANPMGLLLSIMSDGFVRNIFLIKRTTYSYAGMFLLLSVVS